MGHFKLAFDTDNAAFEDTDGPQEIARILRLSASLVEQGGTVARVIDSNGNVVGSWKWEQG